MLNGPISWLKRPPKCGRGSKSLRAFAVWALVLYWKILFREQIHNFCKVFLFNNLIYKFPSYASYSDIHPPVLISTWLTIKVSPSKCSFLQRNVRESRPTCVDLPLFFGWRMKGMKVGIMASFQSRLRPVC